MSDFYDHEDTFLPELPELPEGLIDGSKVARISLARLVYYAMVEQAITDQRAPHSTLSRLMQPMTATDYEDFINKRKN